MWRYEFQQMAGSESLSSGFIVFEASEPRFVVDVAAFDDGLQPAKPELAARWAWRHRRCPMAEAMARALCHRMNG